MKGLESISPCSRQGTFHHSWRVGRWVNSDTCSLSAASVTLLLAYALVSRHEWSRRGTPPDTIEQIRWLKRAHILRRNSGRVQTEATDSSLFLNLMLADLLQAMGNMPSIKWMRDGVRSRVAVGDHDSETHALFLVHHQRVAMHSAGCHQADWNQRSGFNVSLPYKIRVQAVSSKALTISCRSLVRALLLCAYRLQRLTFLQILLGNCRSHLLSSRTSMESPTAYIQVHGDWCMGHHCTGGWHPEYRASE
jgi:hypothetical protein